METEGEREKQHDRKRKSEKARMGMREGEKIFPGLCTSIFFSAQRKPIGLLWQPPGTSVHLMLRDLLERADQLIHRRGTS